MHNDRRKNVFLAISAIIRGLELDQIAFRYDEDAPRDALDIVRGRQTDLNLGASALDPS